MISNEQYTWYTQINHAENRIGHHSGIGKWERPL